MEKEEEEKEEQLHSNVNHNYRLKEYRVKGFTPNRHIEFDTNGELEIFE